MLNKTNTETLANLMKLVELWNQLDDEARAVFLEAKLAEARARQAAAAASAMPPATEVVARVVLPEGVSRTQAALAEVDAGARVQDVAAKYNLSQTTIYKAKHRRDKREASHASTPQVVMPVHPPLLG